MNLPVAPAYIANAGNFTGGPPGYRFNLYFPIWNTNWSFGKNGKSAALPQESLVRLLLLPASGA